MSIETDARQEAERRWPALNPDAEELTYPRSAIRRMTRGSFIAGATWALEQAAREPSEDPCPEWKCPDLSSEDRREGKTCPDHPCTCTREPGNADLIRRLHGVIDTALSDSFTVENDRAVGRAEIEAIEAERREAEAVRDEAIAAMRRLADVIEYAEPFAAKQFAGFAAMWDAHPQMVEVVRIARGDTTNQENRSE